MQHVCTYRTRSQGNLLLLSIASGCVVKALGSLTW